RCRKRKESSLAVLPKTRRRRLNINAPTAACEFFAKQDQDPGRGFDPARSTRSLNTTGDDQNIVRIALSALWSSCPQERVFLHKMAPFVSAQNRELAQLRWELEGPE